MEWVSVKDILPDENVTVLVWIGKTVTARLSKGISLSDRERMSKGEIPEPYRGRSKEWHGSDEYGNNKRPYCWIGIGPFQYFGQEVTHWMPLPEPPKKDGE